MSTKRKSIDSFETSPKGEGAMNPFGAALTAFVSTVQPPAVAAKVIASNHASPSPSNTSSEVVPKPTTQQIAKVRPIPVESYKSGPIYSLETARAQNRANREKRLKKQLLLAKDHVTPEFNEVEKKLVRIATKGVVALFNAVEQHQKSIRKVQSAGSLDEKAKRNEMKQVEELATDSFMKTLQEKSKQLAKEKAAKKGQGKRMGDDHESDDSEVGSDHDFSAPTETQRAAAKKRKREESDDEHSDEWDGGKQAAGGNLAMASDAEKNKRRKAEEASGKGWKVFDEGYLVNRKQKGWAHSDSEDDSD